MAELAVAEGGARVLVVEKGARGGSAALSVGMFWAVPDFETLRERVPLGDPDLGRPPSRRYARWASPSESGYRAL